jgi:hypothetical protein
LILGKGQKDVPAYEPILTADFADYNRRWKSFKLDPEIR